MQRTWLPLDRVTGSPEAPAPLLSLWVGDKGKRLIIGGGQIRARTIRADTAALVPFFRVLIIELAKLAVGARARNSRDAKAESARWYP